jgi:hypothetical protein
MNRKPFVNVTLSFTRDSESIREGAFHITTTKWDPQNKQQQEGRIHSNIPLMDVWKVFASIV